MKFIHSARFMVSLLSNLVYNLPEGIRKIKSKDWKCFLEYENVNENLINYKFLFCNKNYSQKIDEDLTNWFKNPFQFSNDINTFILLLKKVFSSLWIYG